MRPSKISKRLLSKVFRSSDAKPEPVRHRQDEKIDTDVVADNQRGRAFQNRTKSSYFAVVCASLYLLELSSRYYRLCWSLSVVKSCLLSSSLFSWYCVSGVFENSSDWKRHHHTIMLWLFTGLTKGKGVYPLTKFLSNSGGTSCSLTFQ